MYQNLVIIYKSEKIRGLAPPARQVKSEIEAPESVHLCEYPTADPALRDPALSERMGLAQLVVNLGHGLREQASQRVRQPLRELMFACAAPRHRGTIESLDDVIQEELNVKT